MTKRNKVLVIEDNEQNLYLVTYILESNGFEVLQARDGQAGMELAVREHPALVLLDIQLPGMDGHAIAGEMRRHEILADIPIVAVTSYAMPGDREKTLAVGCAGYIEKPIDPSTFMDELRRYLPPDEHIEGGMR